MSTTRKMLILFCAVVVLVLAVAGFKILSSHRVSSDPKQLFSTALTGNLSEKAVTCTVTTTKSDQNQKLAVQLDLAGKTNARSVMTISGAGSTVQTEEVVLKTGDYLRYTKVSTPAKSTAAKQPDFSKILNQWIKTDGKTAPQLFGLTALGGCVVPLANLSTVDKATAVSAIEDGKVFATNYKTTKTGALNGATVRKYDVTIQPAPYVKLMQAIGTMYGLSNLKSINVNDYNSKSPRTATFMVDTKTGRLVEIDFTDEPRVVTFTDYGKTPQLKAPAKTLTNQQASKLVE